MANVNWPALTPQEVWDSLRSAPKVAGPWETEDMGSDLRRALDGTVIAIDNLWVTPKYPVAQWRVPNKGKEDADAILRAHGWVLV